MIVPYFLVCLFPLGVYLLVLAAINRRERPFMIGGAWDSLFLSLGLSGILFWLGPAILGILYQRGLMPGETEHSTRQFQQIWSLYPWVWISYYVLILSGQGLMMISRLNKSVVYNVDGAALENIVANVLGEKGFRVARHTGHLLFESTDQTSPTPGVGGAVEVESFPPFRHATIHWHLDDNRIRGAIERDISNRIDQAATPENPAVTWMVAISGVLFGCVFLGALFIILASLLPMRVQ